MSRRPVTLVHRSPDREEKVTPFSFLKLGIPSSEDFYMAVLPFWKKRLAQCSAKKIARSDPYQPNLPAMPVIFFSVTQRKPMLPHL